MNKLQRLIARARAKGYSDALIKAFVEAAIKNKKVRSR